MILSPSSKVKNAQDQPAPPKVADLFEKCRRYTYAKEIMKIGFYPYFHTFSSGTGTEVSINGRRMIMLGSNNYLDLTGHPKVKQAAFEAIEKYGTGCTGSRFLNGTLELHEELEKELARFLGKENALVFSTGFQTNLGVISCLVGKDDRVVIDRHSHASVLDGCRLAFGQTYKFRHNDMEDLEKILASNHEEKATLVIVDGVYSMEGDLSPLPEVVRLAKKYGARILLDDAHAIGVFGEGGRGTAEFFSVLDPVDLIMGTFSKSFASIGGFIAASDEVIHFIKHHARTFIFSASLAPPCVAAARASLEVIQTEPARRQRLWENAKRMKGGLDRLGFNTGSSQSPVIPIIVGENFDTFQFWKELFDAGVYVNSAVSPAVPPGKSLLRTSYMATHTESQLDRVLETFKEVGKKLKII